jgi:F-box domain
MRHGIKGHDELAANIVPNKHRLTTAMPMPSIPVDVLREILEHVDKADLVTLCQVSKICCSYSQDLLYRDIFGFPDTRVVQTLAQSADLARRVRYFVTPFDCPGLGAALRNMSSLRHLDMTRIDDISILDGCTFKLDSIYCYSPNNKSFQQFLNSQPSLTNVTMLATYCKPSPPFDERCLPNLTRVESKPSWLSMLIPGRPVTDVVVLESWLIESFDISIFSLSTAPILSLGILYTEIYPTPGSHLVSIFPSIVDLRLDAYELNWSVRQRLIVIGVLMKKSNIIDHVGL